jgi:protein TonB
VVRPAGPDRSKPAAPLSTDWRDCGFPPEADMEGINQARVTVTVTVRADGTAKSVTVLKDPGFGFGRLARQCGMRKRYAPALNRSGQPVAGTSPPMTIRFTR